MNEYRTPEEDRASAEQDTRIRGVLDQAVRDGASCVIAMKFDEPQDVVELWTNAVWNGLRDGLSGGADHPTLRMEDPLAAIVLLLNDRIQAEADKVMRSLRSAS